MDIVGISFDEQVLTNFSYFFLLHFWFLIFFTKIKFRLQDAIFRVVAAILHLGNIEFTKGSEPDSSQPKDDQSRFHLATAADLFM